MKLKKGIIIIIITLFAYSFFLGGARLWCVAGGFIGTKDDFGNFNKKKKVIL